MTEASAHVLMGIAVVYMLPTIIALLRLKADTLSILVINLFLGWTFVGWVLALSWSVKPKYRQAAGAGR